MSDEMQEIINEFITEAEESLDRIEPMFVELEQNSEDTEMINDIFRSMHTIKGAAGFLGFQSLVDVAHTSENIMKKIRDKELPVSTELMDVILKSVDMLRLLISHLSEGDGVEEDTAPLVNELKNALDNATAIAAGSSPEPADPVQEEVPVSESTPAPSEGTEPETDTAPLSDIDQQIADAFAARDAKNNPAQTPEPESPQATEASAVPPPAAAPSAQARDSKPDKQQKHKDKGAQNLRVDIDRIDKVMDLAGEVVLVRNRMLNISNYFDQKYSHDPLTETLMESVSFLDRVTSEMQLAVMKIRMQPIKKVLGKFPRLSRDMSAAVHKNVELIRTGEATEVDKTVIEHIGDPLTHILRNSIDHGLGTPEERTAIGKPEKGKIEINIYQKGNQVIIEIVDDGKGLDLDNLRKKAAEKGLMSIEEANKLSDEAASEIIFMPGFSTKEVATELSGRGVGMDVVKNNISLLNGFVEVSTERHKGTKFRICIPMTLAIIQSLMVEVSGTKYAIPLSPIEETLKISRDDIDNVTGQNVIVIREKVCPLFELTSLLGVGSVTDNDNSSLYKYIVVIGMGDRKFCVAVDRLLGQEEVVIKNLDGIDTSASNVLGATITGDGKVVFILDVAGISRSMLGAGKG